MYSWWCFLFFYLPLVAVFSQGIFRRKQRPPIDGSWSSWESWSTCFKNTVIRKHFNPQWEDFNVQTRNRTCNSPKPLFGGRNCEPPSHRFRQCACNNPLIGNNRIKDTLISSSSNFNGYPPKEVRLRNTSIGWCAKNKPSYFTETYIQIDFQNFSKIGSIATLDNTKGRVTRYKLKYSLDGKTWNYIYKAERKVVFTGNYLRGKKKINNFSNQPVMKYLRVIPVNSYGLPCLKMELYGCVFTCGKLHTAPFGGLVAYSSDNHDQNCLWRVEVRNTTSLTFVFNVFYVLCKDGYLDFKDGNIAYNNSPLLKRVCLHDENSEIPYLELNANTVWVNFVSNSSSNEVGFNIEYFSKCSQRLELTAGDSINIQSPNFPNNYFNNLNCSWLVIPPPSSRSIEITVNEFNVESSDLKKKICDDDVVDIMVKSYSDDVMKKKASYCNGNRPPKKITIVAHAVLISFKSDIVTSDKGFSFSVISGSKVVMPPGSNGEDTKSKSGHVIIDNTYKSYADKSQSRHTKKRVKPKDDTWTVIIICTFSSLVVVLIAAVVYMNCRRFLINRTAVNEYCAKVAEENRIKKSKLKDKEIHERNVFIPSQCLPSQCTPLKGMHSTTIPESEMFISSNNIKASETTESVSNSELDIHNKVTALDDIDVHNGIVVHSVNEVDVHNEVQSPDEVDVLNEVQSPDEVDVLNEVQSPDEVDVHSEMQSPDEVDGDEVTSYGISTPSSCSPVKSIAVSCGSLDNEELDRESVI